MVCEHIGCLADLPVRKLSSGRASRRCLYYAQTFWILLRIVGAFQSVHQNAEGFRINSQYVMDGPSEIRPRRSVNRRETELKVELTNVDLFVDLGATYVELPSLCRFSQ